MKLRYDIQYRRSNDYRFVTEYSVYWYGVGSAHQLFLKGFKSRGDLETDSRFTGILSQ